MYRKCASEDNVAAVVFYWDCRNGDNFAGWWIGPDIGWKHPGFARHTDGEAATPADRGWHVISDGQDDCSIHVAVVDFDGVPMWSESHLVNSLPKLKFNACGDPAVTAAVSGSYWMDGFNHGRPVYRRDGSSAHAEADAVIFFWDDRDGPVWSGWWVSPKLGWDHDGFLHNPDTSSQLPPTMGWAVLICDATEETLELVHALREQP